MNLKDRELDWDHIPLLHDDFSPVLEQNAANLVNVNERLQFLKEDVNADPEIVAALEETIASLKERRDQLLKMKAMRELIGEDEARYEERRREEAKKRNRNPKLDEAISKVFTKMHPYDCQCPECTGEP